jgi:hypothetical protein
MGLESDKVQVIQEEMAGHLVARKIIHPFWDVKSLLQPIKRKTGQGSF